MSKRSYSDREKAEALAALDANGGNESLTSKQLGIPRQTLREWAAGRMISIDVPDIRQLKKKELSDKLEEVAHALVGNIFTRATNDYSPMVPLKDFATTLGIAIDKMQLLRGQPTGINEQRISQDEVIEKAAERLQKRATDKGRTLSIEAARKLVASQVQTSDAVH